MKRHPMAWTAPSLGLAVIWIPKAGSTSLLAALMTAEGHDVAGMNPAELHDAGVLPRGDPRRLRRDGVFVAAFVRHPLARLHAVWRGKVYRPPETKRSRLLRAGFIEGCPFAAFIARLDEIGTGCDPHVFPQRRYVMPGGELAADMVGRIEEADLMWPRLQAMFPGLGALPRLNAGGGEDWWAAYDTAGRETAGRLYAEDMRLFGYEDVPA